MSIMFNSLIELIRELYKTNDYISLHEPVFVGNEKKYVMEALDSTYVSSVGAFVDEFEQRISDFTKVKYAVATVNGTSALHSSLLLAGVSEDDIVITQSLSFIATTNAIFIL